MRASTHARNLLVGLAAALFLPTAAPAAGPPQEPSLEEAILALARDAQREARLSGLSLVVDVGGETLASGGWGWSDVGGRKAATAESSWRAGGLLTPLLAVAALDLARAGSLDLDAPVARWLPELAREGAPVLVRDLLRQSSGLPPLEDLPPQVRATAAPEALLAAVAERPLLAEPGTCFAYSDANDLALGLVLEAVAERPVSELLAQRVFAPLGLEDTRWCREGAPLSDVPGFVEVAGEQAPRARSLFGADELCSTAPDLVRLARGVVSRELFGEREVRLISAPAELRGGQTLPWSHGLNVVDVGGHAALLAGGGAAGASVHVAFVPALDLTLALLAEGQGAELDELERRILRLVLEVPEPRVVDLALTPQEAERYSGEYYLGCTRIVVRLEGEHLRLEDPERALTLLSQGRGRFVAQDDPQLRVRFPEGVGPAPWLELEQRGALSRATRIAGALVPPGGAR